MFTPREIRDTEFERIVRGYNPEDVDGFLAQIADQIEQIEADKAASEKKLMILAEKVDEMREDEGRLRSVLISAEKMKEGILGDAQQHSQNMIAEATQRSEMLIGDAQQRYDSIIGEISSQAAQEEARLKSLKTQVASFKNNVLAIYKNHLELLKDIPDYDIDISELEAAEETDFMSDSSSGEQADMLEMPAIEPMSANLHTEPTSAGSFAFGDFKSSASEQRIQPVAQPKPVLNEIKPQTQGSTFSSFVSEDDSKNSSFGKLDFGDSFSFGRD